MLAWLPGHASIVPVGVAGFWCDASDECWVYQLVLTT